MSKNKTLHVVRHAKSAWDYENIADIDRPLKLKGIKKAYEMGRRMKLRNSVPEIIFSSPANRALHTATIFARVIELPALNISLTDKLYCCNPESILELVKNADNKYYSIMICGHNPDFTDFVNMFASEPIFNVPTAGVVSISFNAKNWVAIGKETVTDFFVDFPKNDFMADTLV